MITALARRVRRFHIGSPTRHLNNCVRGLENLPITGLELNADRAG